VQPPPSQPPQVYTEEHGARFQSRVKKLEIACLSKPVPTNRPRCDVHEIEVPTDPADVLIAKAMKVCG